ncbi:hypothetical protein MSEO_18730 [Mycobacterium seoulense]|uniref:Uncharacterized protein n=1 Tax=Mycobacterium seoulense TaxID=386911 RepID=A0A7I7NYT2_9MYCO|nr:hypothetical protein MSEO_18730 [Mycobacterium seoulense]
MRTPSASSVSAPPANDDVARLPCLTTGTPAAATTIAAMVDRLTVLMPSPPVPTMSTASSRMAGIGRARLSMTSASSLTSAEVGTFIVIATAKAATWAGLASPAMTRSMAQAAWPRTRSRPSVNRARTCGHDGAAPGPAVEPPGGEASGDTATRRWSHADPTSPNRREKPPAADPVATRKDQMPPRVEFNNYKASYLRM